MGIWETDVSGTTEVPDSCGSVCGNRPGWPRPASEKLAKSSHSGNTESLILIFQVGLQCKPLKEELLSDHRLLWLVTFYTAILTEENLPLMFSWDIAILLSLAWCHFCTLSFMSSKICLKHTGVVLHSLTCIHKSWIQILTQKSS